MKYKMVIAFQFVLSLILTLYGEISMAKSLCPEDVEGLLPPTPRDKNETIAAVVQDPVVQDAVQQAASNGSLNGLVVKKNVYIMPATNPNKVLSKREHLLVVPTENLEDVRKNITETMATTSTESPSFLESDVDEYASEGNESDRNTVDSRTLPEATYPTQPTSSDEKRKGETEFLKDAISHGVSLPEDESRKVAVPIVAVIDPSNTEKGKVNSPIVAILPNQPNNHALNNQVQFLKDNSDTIQRKAQDYIDQSSLTIVPDYRKSSTPAEITVSLSSTQETAPISLWSDRRTPSLATEDTYLRKSAGMPRWEMIVPIVRDDEDKDHSKETGDMDVAEDIIFRPLFRYREQTQQRSKYYDESNRRYSYTPYRDYSSYYPRRAYFYRPRYDDY